MSSLTIDNKLLSNDTKLVMLIAKDSCDVCEYENLMKNINWYFVIGKLAQHKLIENAYRVLFNNRILHQLPIQVAEILRKVYESDKKRNNEMNIYYDMVTQQLITANINFAVIKGLYLQHTVFHSFTRNYWDVDILINKFDFPKVKDIMYSLGFNQCKLDWYYNEETEFTRKEDVFYQMALHQYLPFNKRVGRMDIVSFDFQFEIIGVKESSSSIQNILEEHTKCINGIYGLDNEWNIILLCMHLYIDCTVINELNRGKGYRLYNMRDISVYLESIKITDDLIDILVQAAKKYNLLDQVLFALSITNYFFSTKTLKYILDKFCFNLENYLIIELETNIEEIMRYMNLIE